MTEDDPVYVEPDGLPVRTIKPHSLDKRFFVRRYANIVGPALHGRFTLAWIEPFAGPGLLRLEERPLDDRYLEGSPFDALRIKAPMHRYVFSDLDAGAVEALAARIDASGLRDRVRDRVEVFQADVNGKEWADAVRRAMKGRDVLGFVYLDPQGLELEMATIERLAPYRCDLILNVPTMAFDRTMAARTPGKLARALGVDDPAKFLQSHDPKLAAVQHYHQRLRELGWSYVATPQSVRMRTQREVYQVVVASKNELAVDFFRKATSRESGGVQQLPGF